jgi:hypothetical protein
MASRKRAREEVEENDVGQSLKKPGLLERLRNMWEFANLMQFIYFFGKAVKIDDDFDIEVPSAVLCFLTRPSAGVSIGSELVKNGAGEIGLT